MRGRYVLLIVGILGALAAPALGLTRSDASRPAPTTRVPRGFIGMVVDGPVLSRGINLNQQLGRMAASGVQTVRVQFSWAHAQPHPNWQSVPLAYWKYFTGAGNAVPTYFLATDRIVGLAAEHHLAVLPVVIGAPSWDAYPTGNHIQPAHDGPYGAYLKQLVHRYGPHGTFWSSHRSIPREPITSWQIWNEPDLSYFWDTPEFARSYVALLRVAHRAIKRADPRAEVVLASLTGQSWKGLALIYNIRGARNLFDAVGENTYAPSPGAVISVLRRVRMTMDRHGDATKPLIDTEVGWPSAQGKTGLTLGIATTKHGQAHKLSQLLPLLAANRNSLNLKAFYYYTWMSSDQVGALSPFAFAGLFGYRSANDKVYAKPAAAAFKREAFHLEGRG